jgi:hypothetical protein
MSRLNTDLSSLSSINFKKVTKHGLFNIAALTTLNNKL